MEILLRLRLRLGYVDFAVTFVILAIDIDTYTFNNIWEIIIIGNQYS